MIDGNKRYIVMLGGPSGCGKSYIVNKLLQDDLFIKVPQYTTRKIRKHEDPYEYYFVNEDHYDLISDKLTAKTCFNGNKYGTIPVFPKNKISLVIVNESGFKDMYNYLLDKEDIEKIFILIDSEIPKVRENRDNSIVNDERIKMYNIFNTMKEKNEKVLQYKNTKNNYIDFEDVKKDILNKFNQ